MVKGPKGPCGAVGIPLPSAMAATFFSSHSPPTIVTSGMMTSHQTPVHHGPEPLPVHQAFASGQRHVDMIPYGPVALVVFIGHGFLVPVKIQVPEGVEYLAPAPGGEVAVAVDQQGDLRTDRVTHRFHAGNAFAGVGGPVDPAWHPVEGGQFYGVESIRNRGGRVPCEPRGRPVGRGPVDVGIEGYLIMGIVLR